MELNILYFKGLLIKISITLYISVPERIVLFKQIVVVMGGTLGQFFLSLKRTLNFSG